ncbi:Uncharacterized protein HZ326_12975 [Fusarium oxysporum f. sp. albedinis]|nr:Uncharacterized protein HZ326_12975 [Fusarium oxysporum f. sp. albedinis]
MTACPQAPLVPVLKAMTTLTSSRPLVVVSRRAIAQISHSEPRRLCHQHQDSTRKHFPSLTQICRRIMCTNLTGIIRSMLVSSASAATNITGRSKHSFGTRTTYSDRRISLGALASLARDPKEQTDISIAEHETCKKYLMAQCEKGLEAWLS